jgi:hypothetical protein
MRDPCSGTLWAAVWSHSLDEIYWPIPGQVLNFCGRRVSCHSLQLLTSYMCKQAFSCLTSIKSKDRNHLASVEDKHRVCLSKVWPRIEYLCSKSNHRFHIKEENFKICFCSKFDTVLQWYFCSHCCDLYYDFH